MKLLKGWNTIHIYIIYYIGHENYIKQYLCHSFCIKGSIWWIVYEYFYLIFHFYICIFANLYNRRSTLCHTFDLPKVTLLGHTFLMIKIHMNANIMNTQISHFNKYDLKGRSLKVTKVHPILALTQPFPYWMVHWCFPLQIVWISLSFSLSLSKSSALSLIALNANLWTFSTLFT